MSLNPDGDESYRLTPCPIKARNYVRTLMHDEVENRFTPADFNPEKLGISSQRMDKFNSRKEILPIS